MTSSLSVTQKSMDKSQAITQKSIDTCNANLDNFDKAFHSKRGSKKEAVHAWGKINNTIITLECGKEVTHEYMKVGINIHVKVCKVCKM